MKLALLRHGPTAWNGEGRIQGQLDLPLTAEGRAQMLSRTLPARFSHARMFTSPLIRARETASLLGLVNASVDERLIEHNWGDWQGMTRAEILARDGADAFERAGRGVDFRPPGGERTTDLLARVIGFLRDIARSEDDAVAVTHRGVMRSAYAIATGWQMLTPMPQALDLSRALVLRLDAQGDATIGELNLPLERRSRPISI